MMSEVFGYGPVWIVVALLATIGTGVCCGSMSLGELVVGRMIQGIGGGGAMSLCFVAMRESAPEAIHSRYSCYILLMRMVGAILGLVIGGLFIDYGDWTWVFYFNFVFCALGLLSIPFAVDLRVLKHKPLRQLRILDWTGVTMAFFGFSGVLVGLSFGGTSYQWSEWQTIVPFTVGGLVILALVFHQSQRSAHPQFGRTVFRSKMMTMTYIGCFLHGLVVSYPISVKFFFCLTYRSRPFATSNSSHCTLSQPSTCRLRFLVWHYLLW